MPRDKESHKKSITAPYSTTLLVAGPREALLEATSYPAGEYMTHALESRLQVWRLAPFAKPTNHSAEIYNNQPMV